MDITDALKIAYGEAYATNTTNTLVQQTQMQIGQRPTYATDRIVIDPQAAATYGQSNQVNTAFDLQARKAFARAVLGLNPPPTAEQTPPLPPEPAPAPHDFSNPYLRIGKDGPLCCAKCALSFGRSAEPCDVSHLYGKTPQDFVEMYKDADTGFALTTEWHPPRQRMPRPDAWQSSALMGGAWDLASAERRDGTRGRKRLPPR